MSTFDDELINDFVVEANEHLSDMENQFLQIEELGEEIDLDLVNGVFRGIHSIKGAAGFLGLQTVQDLSHVLENILNMIRNFELVPTSSIVDVMLRATDTLVSLVEDIFNSNDVDVSHHVTELEAVITANSAKSEPEPVVQEGVEPSVETTTEPVVETAMSVEDELEAAFAEAAAKKAQAMAEEKATPVAAPVASAPAPVTPEPVKSKKALKPKETASKVESSIRVSVTTLDKLMNLAGELVLGRNQLLQAIDTIEDGSGLDMVASRLDQVTSELQEAIMETRMQQIGTVFSKFPRVVRDLASKLSKDIELEITGKDVEVDKTIIEAIGDPLTHLIRNSVDHGIEMAGVRAAAGKPEIGRLDLRAAYKAGKVCIEIEDDGAGINPEIMKTKAVEKGVITQERADQMSDREAVRLIFHAGFSTAEKVTDVSGRGVGMDVVISNISKLGGTVDIDSVVGRGTCIIVTLPLTLAIIPSLIVASGNDKFAIPQVNISELVRVRESEKETRLGMVKNAEVLRLRGDLLPLIRLNKCLGLEKANSDTSELSTTKTKRNATSIIVVETGQSQFGIVVDGLFDSEEIVVKPLGKHNKGSNCISGATILGDGNIALILDIPGIASHADIRADEQTLEDQNENNEEEVVKEDSQSVLLFTNGPNEYFAVPMDLVSRIERVKQEHVDSVGGQEVLQYNSATLPLLRLENIVSAKAAENEENFYVIVYNVCGKEIGLVAPSLEDICEVEMNVDTVTFTEPGVIGSLVIEKKTIRLIDLYQITQISHSEWFEEDASAGDSGEGGSAEDKQTYILLAEDSGFFRKQVQSIFEEHGYLVEGCEDGLIAWEKLKSGEYDFDLVVTDIEMPNMNGFELCRHIKEAAEYKHLPVIALTSLAATTDIQHGLDVGIDDYQIKMDRERLMESVRNFSGAACRADEKKKNASQSGKLVRSN